MPDTNWNDMADYLARTRGLYLNDDYLEFLVRNVWRLDAPTALIDFGCGFGYMGLKLLPILPEGSSYTGLDLATSLLERAQELFANAPYQTRFIKADVTADVATAGVVDRSYDVAICHALMLHVTDPMVVLERMKRCVKPGGLVICIEPYRIGSMADYYHGGRQSDYVKLGILQSLYEEAASRTGKDGNVGMKLPLYMDRIGLTGVDCRLSDRVNLLLPSQAENQKALVRDSLRADGVGAAPEEPSEAFRERLVARGLSPKQADLQYAAECAVAARFAEDDLEVVWACGMMISYGTVPE